MKKIFFAILMVALFLTGCSGEKSTEIILSDSGITVDGKAVTDTGDIYAKNDIVYYEEGHDATYGEGEEKDAHSKEVADEHTVLHITRPGTYTLSGTLSKGQIAVDLGEDAKNDPESVVNLILDGVDVNCEVAPAVIFYNVYECGDKDNATKDVDTTDAGANIILADGSENIVNGSYVARIYDPDTVINGDVSEAKKLHKYDGAFYSKMSMNIDGNGRLVINADNEGLGTEMHLTINGGDIEINSGNDGINTNEDNVSVTTLNGGNLKIRVTGETGEGDGIDSNGWLVINGGSLIAEACSVSADAGIDSDMGIYINGGEVIATGSMLDRIEDGGQNYAVFNFLEKQGGKEVVLKNSADEEIIKITPENNYSVLILSSDKLVSGEYTILVDGEKHSVMEQMGGMRPQGGMPPEGFGDREPPEEFKEGTPPKEFFEGKEPPEGFDGKERFDRRYNINTDNLSDVVTIKDGGNMFMVV